TASRDGVTYSNECESGGGERERHAQPVRDDEEDPEPGTSDRHASQQHHHGGRARRQASRNPHAKQAAQAREAGAIVGMLVMAVAVGVLIVAVRAVAVAVMVVAVAVGM